MDNQNPMTNGGMPQNATPPQDQANIDQIHTSSVVVQPDGENASAEPTAPDPNLVNVQTQSIVKSAREEAAVELAQVKAYNDEMLRRERAAEGANKAKRTGLIIFGIILGIAIVGATAWLVVNSIILAQRPADPGEDPTVVDPTQLGEVDGYKCTTTKCEKVVDLPDGRIIIRDTNYYIYDLEKKEATLTSIDNRDFHAIIPFYWGDRLLAELDPESDSSALYSITENRSLTTYSYDTIYHDIKDDVYKNQTNLLGNYIIVKGSGYYRMLSAAMGTEVARGTNKVFKYANYFFGYEANNEVRAYSSSGRQIKIAYSGEDFYVKDNKYLVHVDKDGGCEVYDGSSEEPLSEGSLVDYLWDIDAEQMRATLDKNKTFYKIAKN